MILDLVKRTPVHSPPKPSPPEVRYVKNGVTVPPPIPTEPKQPSRIWCFFGVHKYTIHKESSWSRTDNGRQIAKGPMYILHCTACGKVKAECL